MPNNFTPKVCMSTYRSCHLLIRNVMNYENIFESIRNNLNKQIDHGFILINLCEDSGIC